MANISTIVIKAYTWISNFFPHDCVLCGLESQQTFNLCSVCQQDLPHLYHSCSCCGIPLTSNDSRCGECLQTPPPYHTTIAGFHYQDYIRILIHGFKFQHKFEYGQVLAKLLANKIHRSHDMPWPDLLIPVPLHRSRLLKRGFNQGTILANIIGKQFDIPVDYKSCRRIRATAPQVGMNRHQRQQNIRQAFTVNKPFTGKHIAIIDDVVTTASTVSELSRMLLQHGAKQVDVWCCARTQLK